MVDEFEQWLSSLIEDTPPSDELDSLLFILKKRGDFAHLELNFYEGKPTLNKLAFRPLEAQFFALKKLNNVDDKILFNRVKDLLDEIFFKSYFKNYFKSKKIYILFKDNIEYLFTV